MAGYIVPDIEAKELNGSDIAVWAALCRFAQWEYIDNLPAKSIDGSCYPSIQMIVDKAHVARGTVINSLKHLEDLGYMVRTRVGHGVAYTLLTDQYKKSNSCTSKVQNLDSSDEQKYNDCILKVQPLNSQESESTTIELQKYNDCTLKVQPLDTNNTYNNTINKPERSVRASDEVGNFTDGNNKKQRKASQRPYPGLPYDKNALGALTEMYELVPDYVPDPPLEVRFLQELAQEYPDADLFRQFRRARDWIAGAPPHKRPKKDLRKFLRNWIANGERYGENQKPPDTRYEADAPMFVPLERDT